MISFYRLKAQIIFNKLRNLSAAGRAGRILLLFLGAGSFYGIYHVFLRIFVYLNQLPLFGYYLIFRLFSFLFLVFLIMVPLSALLNSFSLFFSSRDIPFLMLLPVPSGGIFSLKYSELLYHTLWMPGLILLPVLLAYRKVFALSAGAAAAYLFFVFLFFVFLCGAGFSFASLLVSVFPRTRLRDYALTVFALLFAGFYVFFRYLEPEKFLKADTLSTATSYLQHLKNPSYLPSYWVAQALLFLTEKDLVSWQALFWMALLVSAVSISGIFMYGEKKFFALYLKQKHVPFFPPFKPFPEKKIWQEFNRRLLVRDSSLASQLLLIIALIFLYLFNLKKMPLADYPEVKNIISFFNLGMVGMIQLAIGMRFIFPHFSRQLNTLWLQFILPVKREELFRMHLRFYIVPVTLLGFFLVISSGLILNIYPPLFAVQLAGVLFLGPVTANLCYCMGIIFPLKKFENVSQIESSGGGVLCMLFGIFYLVLALGVLAFPVRLIFLRKFGFNPGLSVLTGGFPVFFMILQAFFYYPLRKFAFQKYSRYSL